MRYPFLLVVLLALVSSCAKKVSKFYPEIIPRGSNATLMLNKEGRHSVNLTFFGCGNMIIEQDGDAILTDPFFSNQKLSKSFIGKVKTNPVLYEIWKGRVQQQASRGMVRAGLVSHTHYDHVMDLPTLLQAHYFNKMEAVYGNSHLPQMMVNFQKEGVPVKEFPGGWVSVTPNIRFLAIKSSHAPQRGKKLYMDKDFDAGYFKQNLVWPDAKIKTGKWTTGTTYSYLVDFIQGDTLRMFIQTSTSQYPSGRPPQDELKQKKVDVAVLCYASTTNVTTYPKGIVDELKPSKVILVHWEDLFRAPKTDDDVMLVRGTNPKKARKAWDALGKKRDFFMMPKPGTKIEIRK